MFRGSSLLAVVGFAVVLTAACSLGGGQASTSNGRATQACTLSTLRAAPAGLPSGGLARAGPLWFSAFGRVSPGMPARMAPGGGPYDGWKVVVLPDPSATGYVGLFGKSCSTGSPVKFCYASLGACTWDTRNSSSVTELYIGPIQKSDYWTGYMAFPGPGLMRLTATNGHAIAGSVVIEVPLISNG